MSRETDSSSSGPQRRGGAAYPSGTPPYGSPAGAREPGTGVDADQRAAETRPDESSETQTTLTTRVRINIPGSRPIPPVVMRTPVNEGDKSGSGAGDTGAPAPAGSAGGAGRASGGASGGVSGGASAGSARSDQTAGGSGGVSAAGAGAASASASADGPAEGKASDWFSPRKPPAPARGSGGAPGGPGGPGGSGGGPGGPGAGAPGSGVPGAGGPGADGLGGPGPGGPGGPGGSGGPGAGGPGGPGAGSPGGPGAGGPGGPGGPSGPGVDTRGFDTHGSGGASQHGGPPYGPGNGQPTGPTTGPVTGEGPGFRQDGGTPAGGTPAGVPPRMSDDTAQLTPQPPAPVPAPGPGGQVSGDTLNSGIPTALPAQGAFPPGPQDGPPARPGLDAPRPSAPASRAPKKKGRSKLMLAGVGVVVIAGGLYGAGLLMNHSDVPKGTTVLGVDIGGGTRDDAVKKLDAALGERATQPIELSVNGEKAELTPAQAGLSLDDQATVRAAAVSDYNPVSVVGSLFGGERTVDPVMPTDEEKLADALERVVGGQNPANEGGIKLEAGKAVPVYGKPANKVNIQGAVTAVRAAYRAQVETGQRRPVELPVATTDPKVTKAEVDRMMKEFAEPAMSGLITVRAETGQTVSFSPERSIPKFVSVVADKDGKLTQKYDLEALQDLYGTIFDGVLITKADGSKKQLSPQEVAAAAGQAMLGKTPQERIVTIPTNPN
ncbi:hypothetical protein ACX6XY_08315 [Streptomyces sp. O3]